MSFEYYAFNDSASKPTMYLCSRMSDEFPLIVNCAGSVRLSFPFTTDNPLGREDYYLLYMLSGEMEVSLPHGARTAKSGDYLLFPPHYRYIYKYDGGEELNYLWVHFTGSYAEGFLRECGFSTLPVLHKSESEGKVASLFANLFRCFENTSPLSRPQSAAALEEIILKLAQELYQKEKSPPLERALRVIHSSYLKEVKIPELARLENLSNSRFIALFKEKMGLSPTAYIIKRRMDAASELLESTDIPIRQISLMVGYEDQHFFSKLFKKHVGASPSEYRHENRAKSADK